MEAKNTELIKYNSGTQVSSPIIPRRSESAGEMTAQKKKKTKAVSTGELRVGKNPVKRTNRKKEGGKNTGAFYDL